MTSMNTLFNTNADELFTNYSISEIKLMYNDVEKELSRKKNELRVLVGEKYRDFVEISEKIAEMNILANSITSDISFISEDLTSLNVNRTKQNLAIGNELLLSNNKYNEIAVLNKLLIDIENQIWTEMENRKFIVATMLLQLAVHVKTVLSLDSSLGIQSSFPVFSVSWNSILRFPVLITYLIEEELKSSNLSPTTACQCLCSIAILENLDCIDVIQRFLRLRLGTLKYTLSNDNMTQKVRVRILNSFLIIISTIEILYHCFRKEMPNRTEGEYWSNMANMCSSTSDPIFDLVNIDSTAKLGKIYVPSAIQTFRLKFVKSQEPLDPTKYGQNINDWLEEVKQCSASRITSLLNLVGKLQTLNLLNQSVRPIRNEWNPVMECFDLQHNTNIWKELYEPLITERTKTLLLQLWNELFNRVCHQIDNCVAELSETEKQEIEESLHASLWSNFDEDFSEKSPGSKSLQPKGLVMKSAGLSPNAGKLCIFVEALISNLMTEFTTINSSNDAESDESTILKEYQQACCITFVERLGNFITEIVSADNVHTSVFLLLARFLCGIASFCESLKQCILLTNEKSEKWQTISIKLHEQSLNVWEKWSSLSVESLFDKFSTSFDHDVTSLNFRVQYFPKPDVMSLTGKSELDLEIDSSLYVPVQASFPVQNLLKLLSSLVADSLPPRLIIDKMTYEMLSKLFKFLEEQIEKALHQAVPIQFLFDAKYLNSFLLPVDNNELIEQSKTVISKCEFKIDPVDFNAISSLLSENVRQFTYRTHSIFGLLVPDKSRLSVNSFSENSDDPFVTYSGASNVPWFSLLPLSVNTKI